jgi:hypothetical protein
MRTRGGHTDFDKLVRRILLDIALLQWVCNARQV